MVGGIPRGTGPVEGLRLQAICRKPPAYLRMRPQIVDVIHLVPNDYRAHAHHSTLDAANGRLSRCGSRAAAILMWASVEQVVLSPGAQARPGQIFTDFFRFSIAAICALARRRAESNLFIIVRPCSQIPLTGRRPSHRRSIGLQGPSPPLPPPPPPLPSSPHPILRTHQSDLAPRWATRRP